MFRMDEMREIHILFSQPLLKVVVVVIPMLADRYINLALGVLIQVMAVVTVVMEVHPILGVLEVVAVLADMLVPEAPDSVLLDKVLPVMPVQAELVGVP